MKLVQENPANPVAHLSLGISLLEARRFEEASGAYQKAMDLDPKLLEAYRGFIIACTRTGDDKKAMAVLQKMKSIAPPTADGYFNLGEVMYSLRLWNEAISAWQEVIKIKPSSINSWVNIGFAWIELRELKKAQSAFQEVVKINPQHETGHYELADIAIQLADFETAKKEVAELYKLGSKRADWLDYRVNHGR